MNDKELEKLAIELRGAYFQEVDPSEEWDTLADSLKQKWINVAKWVTDVHDPIVERIARYGSA